MKVNMSAIVSKYRPIADLHEELFGNRPSAVTTHRYVKYGRDGKKLRAVKAGGKLLCTAEDLIEFLTVDADGESGGPIERELTPAAVAKKQALAEAELDKLGI